MTDKDSTAKRIDWDALYARITSAQERMRREFVLTPEQERLILHERARALAAEAPPGPGATIQVAAFLLARETYGIESEYVREVTPLKEFTPLPGTPPFVLGIMNLRGRILSVLDLKRVFELPPQGLGDLNRVLVLHSPEMEFGVLADAVLGLQTVPVRALAPAPATLTGPRADYLKGITPEREIILDGQKLLSDSRLVVRD